MFLAKGMGSPSLARPSRVAMRQSPESAIAASSADSNSQPSPAQRSVVVKLLGQFSRTALTGALAFLDDAPGNLPWIFVGRVHQENVPRRVAEQRTRSDQPHVGSV